MKKTLTKVAAIPLCAAALGLASANSHGAYEGYANDFLQQFSWNSTAQRYEIGGFRLQDQDVPINYWRGRGVHNTYEWGSGSYPGPSNKFEDYLTNFGMFFEIDLNWSNGGWYVGHGTPEDTNCTWFDGGNDNFTECLHKINAHMNANPNRDAIFLNFDLKDGISYDDPVTNLTQYAPMNDAISNILGSKVYTPKEFADRYSVGSKNLRMAVKSVGWPTFKELKGRFMCFVSGNTDTYTHNYLERCLANWNNCQCFISVKANGGESEIHEPRYWDRVDDDYDDPYSTAEANAVIITNPKHSSGNNWHAQADDMGFMSRNWTFSGSGSASDVSGCFEAQEGRLNLCGADLQNDDKFSSYKSAVDRIPEYWSDGFSEENKGVGYCKPPMVAVGLRCEGSYCDNKQLLCRQIASVYSGAKLVSINSTGFFSEEGSGMATSHGDTSFITGITCSGSNCDNLKLTYADKLTYGSSTLEPTGSSYTTGWISEELPNNEAICKPGFAVSNIQCSGSKCDNLKLTCRKYKSSNGNRLDPGDAIHVGEYLESGSIHRLTFSYDGKVKIIKPDGTEGWVMPNESGQAKGAVIFGFDNNKNLYARAADGTLLWARGGANGEVGAYARLENYHMVIRDSNDHALWTSSCDCDPNGPGQ